MKFLKYRHTWAWGDNEWNYILLHERYITSDDEFEDLIQNISKENNWSDKYRGVEHEVVDYPGNDWMKNELERCKTSIKFMEEKLGLYTALFYRYGGK